METGVLTVNIPARIILVVSAIALVVALLILIGALNWIADDAAVNKRAVEVLIVYWASFCLLILIVAGVRKHPKELLLAVVSLALVLLLAEAALRILTPDRAKPQMAGLRSSTLHHTLPPNMEMLMGVFDGKPVVVRTNEDGIRTGYTRESFLSHRSRVVLLGDSFVFGLGVKQEETCAAVAERTLRERLRRDNIAVMGASAISYSPLLLQQLYRYKVAAYEPGVVMLLLDVTDVGDDLMYEREAIRDGDEIRFSLPDERKRRFYSAVYQALRPLLERLGKDFAYPYYTFLSPGRASYDYYNFDLEVGGVIEKNRYFVYRHPLAETRMYFDRMMRNVDRIAQGVKENGGTFVLVVTPRYHHWNDHECPDNWEIRQYQYTVSDPYEFEYLRFFEEVKDSLDYEVLNLLPAFQQTEESPLVFRADPHWNPAGHAFVGRLLADHLLERGIVR